MKTRLLCIMSLLVLAACGNQEQHTSVLPPPANASRAPLTGLQGKEMPPSLKISGLYIGMDIQSVPNAMMEILAEKQLSDFSFTDPIRMGDGTQCVLMYTKPFLRAIQSRMQERYGSARAQAKIDEEILTSCTNSDGVLAVKSDVHGRVNRIEFNDTKDIFDAAGLSPADFVKKLSGKYHIPEMRPDDTKTSWDYLGADGTRVVVNAKEVLGIPMLRLYMSKQE